MRRPPKGHWSSGVDLSKLSEHTVHADRWDVRDFKRMSAEAAELAAAGNKLADFAPTGGPLMADAFHLLHKAVPRLRDIEDVRPDHLVNHAVMSEAAELPESRSFRAYTRNDDVAAALGAAALEPELETLLDRQQLLQDTANQLMEKMAELAAARQEKVDLDDLVAKWSEEHPDEEVPGEIDGQEVAGQGEGLDAQIEALTEETDELGEQLEEGIQAEGPSIRAFLTQAMGKAAQAAAQIAAMSRSWGLSPGQMQRLPADERMKLAKRMNTPRMRQLADRIGAIRNLALTEQLRKTDLAADEIVNITMGNDLERVVPTELAKLGDPVRKLEFLRDFAESKLLQYELAGTERLAKGAIILCADEETEILTMSGWKSYTDLEVGEMVLTLDHESGMSEWSPLLRVNVFPAERRTMLSLEGQRHSSLTTMDHRWPVTGYRYEHKRRINTREWRSSATLKNTDRFVVAAPCVSLPTEPKYQDALVEVIAWVWTEGTILRPGSTVNICQSHKVHATNCTAIRRALTTLYGPAHGGDMRKLRGGQRPAWIEESGAPGITIFRLNRVASAPVLEHLDSQKVVAPSFIASLTASQLQLFVDRSLDGDGQRRAGVDILGQRVEARNKSFEMACVLLGSAVKTVAYAEKRPERKPGTHQFFTSALRSVSNIHITPKNGTFKHGLVDHDGVVWCPTTANGTWLARRHGTIYYTGNCEDGSSSMGGDRELWAKAVMGALLDIARRQKRIFRLIHFGSPGLIVEINFEKPSDYTVDRVLDAFELFMNSGTDFATPLNKAVEYLKIEHRDTGRVSADIVFVTDGECSVTDQFQSWFQEEKDRLGFTLWGVNIGGPKTSEPLYSLADGKVCGVSDLLSGEEIRSVFRGI